jgi:hypothetical protein
VIFVIKADFNNFGRNAQSNANGHHSTNCTNDQAHCIVGFQMLYN